MWRQSEQRPDPEQIRKLRTIAEALLRYLERELVHSDCRRRPAAQMKDLYDAVYLPTAVALADGLRSLELDNLSILRQPLCEELASTQLRIVLELLYNVVTVLSEN